MTDIKAFKLENNITVIHQKEKTSLAHVRIYFKVGAIVEPAKQKGIAHLTEHLMFKGTKTRTSAEITKLLEIKGAKINASTNQEETVYHASVRPEFLETILDLYADMIQNKSITAAEFEKEKLVVLQEIKMDQDDYDGCNLDNLFKRLYGLDPIVGFENTLRNLTLNDVYAFIKRFYTAENMTISLLSDRSHADVKSLLNRYFGDMATGAKTAYKPLKVKRNQVIKERRGIAQVYIRHIYPLANFTDIKTHTKAVVLCDILSGGLSCVLHREIRDKYGLTYRIYARLGSFKDAALSKNRGVCLNIAASMDNKNLAKYLKVLPELIRQLPNIITAEDLERVKNKRASREFITAETKAESNYFCYTRYVKVTAYGQRDKLYYATTLKEIRTFTRKYLTPDNVSYAQYGPVK